MMHEAQFNNEIRQRQNTDPRHVLEVICTSADGTLEDIWLAELEKLGKWKEYRFGIIMVRYVSTPI